MRVGEERHYMLRRKVGSRSVTLDIDGEECPARGAVLQTRSDPDTGLVDHEVRIEAPDGTELELEVFSGLTTSNVNGTESFMFRARAVDVGSGFWASYDSPMGLRKMGDRPASERVLIPCAWCGRELSPADAMWTSDPYQAELFGDDTEMWMCETCYDDSRMSI